ncbi:lamin tail domain-containing protein [bacterium]|nr:lamin tail domain-containing protein [bacterium]
MYRRFLSYALPGLFLFLVGCSNDDNPSNPTPGDETIDLVINEFIAKNDSTVVDEYGDYDDWFEIYNRGSVEADIGGYTVTDDPAEPTKWRIPDNQPDLTTIPAGGYLVLWADSDTLQGVLHVDFGLSDNGEDIGLFKPDGTPMDLVHYEHQYSNISMGRSPNGSSDWHFLNVPSPGSPNNVPIDNLEPVVTEVQHTPVVPREGQAVLVHVEGFDDKTIESATLSYSVGDGPFEVITMAEDDGDWKAFLPGQDRGAIVRYYVAVADVEGLSVTDPQFAPASNYSYSIPVTDYAPPIFINEFLASNGGTHSDEAGDFDDWIELYNSGSVAIDVAGMYLSDTPSDPYIFQFPMDNPATTTIPAGGFLLIWADNEVEEGALHTNFKLSADGESILLHASDQNENVMIDSYTFDAQEEDISEGRVPDGSSNWVFLSTPTPGTSNAP